MGNLLIETELGRGAYGAVFLARDQLIGRPVALKVLLPRGGEISDADREAFLAEARVVAGIPSPHIVTLFAVHEWDQGGWLIEMEYVDGGSLHDMITAGERFSAERAIPVVRAIFEALRAAHDRGVLHRDIKPANVLMGRDGTVKLADFGLALVTGGEAHPMESGGGIVGTPWYMAPELFRGKPASVRTDLWAMGVLVHEMLAGETPFSQNQLGALLYAITNDAPPPLPTDVAPTLGRLVSRCMAKRPEDRPKSAGDLLLDLDRMSGRMVMPTVAALGSGRLFGRAAEVQHSLEVLSTVASGRAATLSIVGDPGIGKSVLLDELQLTAGPIGFVWLGVTLPKGGGLVRPLLETARGVLSPDGDADAIADRLGSGDFGRAMPILRAMLQPGADLSVQDREQAAWALEQLLHGLGKDAPLALAIEDLHEAGEDDLWLVRELTRRLSGDRFALLTTSRPLAALPEIDEPDGFKVVETMRLEGLSAESIARLLDDRAGGLRVQPRVAERIGRRSAGNPLMALELLRHLQTTGAITEQNDRWEVTDEWDEESLPDGLRGVLLRRIASLDADDRELLEAAAVDGVHFGGAALSAVLEIPKLKLLRRLQRVINARGLVGAADDGYRFENPLLRDTLYEETAPELREALHEALADHLESQDEPVDPERLGTHWEQAGDPTRAQSYLVAAAGAAAQRLERRRATELIDRSGVLTDEPDLDVFARHGESLHLIAMVYRDTNRATNAFALYEWLARAAEHVGDAGLAALVEVQMALTRHLTTGSTEEDRGALRRAVETLPSGRDLGMTHHVLGRIAKAAGEFEEAERQFTAADAVFEEHGLTHLHALALNALASISMRRGDFVGAEALFAEAAATSESIGRHVNAAADRFNQVRCAMYAGRIDGKREILESARRTIELQGSANQAAYAGAFLAELLYALGDLVGATRLSEEFVTNARALESDHIRTTCLVASVQYLGATGDLDAARQNLRDADTEALDDEGLRANCRCADAALRAYSGETDAAAALLGEALRRSSDAGDSPELIASGALHLALLGVDGGVWTEALTLLDGAGDLDANIADMTRAACRGAIAYCDPGGSVGDLDAAADALTSERVGTSRAELRIVAGWFRAEAAHRRGERAAACDAAEQAASGAALLGHVWLEAGVLRYLDELAPSSVRRERRSTLLRRISTGIEADDLREAVTAAWRPQ